MNYRIFYKLIREYATGKISRERFVYEWEQEQKNICLTRWKTK
jgi:ATP-dependent RNA circularization protein (DNA/RNA ligase family)